MNFKVGDEVLRITSRVNHNGMCVGDKDHVVGISDHGNLELKNFGKGHNAENFKLAAPELESELRLCESRKGILCKRIGEDQEEKKSLENRIQELQQAIKECDKPKGRVGIKDATDYGVEYHLACADGGIRLHRKNCLTAGHISMGNLFYDKESAERAVHDRKQRVLRGEDV